MKPVRLLLPFWLLAAFWLLANPYLLLAQNDETPPPIPQVHVVADGENLTVIAAQYGLTVADLLLINNLANDDVLFVGQELIIPGGTGDAIATLYTVQAGDTLASIGEQFNTTAVSILENNRLINSQQPPTAGQTLSLISRTGSAAPQTPLGQPYLVRAGDTLLTIAASHNISPTTLINANQLSYPAYLYPGQRLRLPGTTPYRALPGDWIDITLDPFPLQPGQTAVITAQNVRNEPPNGQFGNQLLRFTPTDTGYAALIGLDAFTPPGSYLLQLESSTPFSTFAQPVQVSASNYVTQAIALPDSLNALLDPTIRTDEETILAPIFTQFTAERQWQGLFQTPVISNTFVTARYGDARSYNGSEINNFHSGVDFSGSIGTPVVAAANGTVVFSDVLNVRGLTVIINHGQGVMTSYSHLSETFVAPGQRVSSGDTIGTIGSTGLSNGPHLHWELRIHNVPVNALQWTERPFP